MSDQQATTCPTCDERTLTGPAGGGTGTCSTCGRRHIVARAVPPRPAPTEQAPDPRRPADRRRQRLQ